MLGSSIILTFILTALFSIITQAFSITDYVLLFSLTWLIIFLSLNYVQYFLKYFIIIFLIATSFYGVYIIENKELWLSELSIESTRSNSLFLLFIFYTCTLIQLFLFDSFTSTELNKIYNYIKSYFSIGIKKYKFLENFIFYAILLFLVAYLAKVSYNPAFSLGVDRFQYRELYLTGFWGACERYIIYISPLFSLFLFSSKPKRFLILSSLTFCSFFMTGVKFGGYLNLFVMWSPVVVLFLQKWRVKHKSVIKPFAFTFVLLFSLFMIPLVHNSVTYGTDISNNFIYLQNRLAQQGQLWWAVYSDKENKPNPQELKDELSALFNSNPDPNLEYGMSKIMFQSAPEEIVIKKLATGSRYAMSTPSSLYYYFGVLGLLIFSTIFSLTYTVVVNWYFICFKCLDIIGILILGKFLLVLPSVFSQSDFDVLFSFKSIFLFCFYLIYLIFLKNIKFK